MDNSPEVRKEEELARLERQIERGSLFTHTIVSRNANRIHEAESFLYGLIDVLIEKGLITQDEVAATTARVRGEMQERGQMVGPSLALRINTINVDQDDFVPVNCAERYPICQAVCCRLHFALSAEEVEAGKVKWDLGAPYHIRQETTGYCHHLDANTRCCTIYKDRPGVCRRYSCANDKRIWKDFANMVLNEEWIGEHLRDNRLRLVASQMQWQPDVADEEPETPNIAQPPSVSQP